MSTPEKLTRGIYKRGNIYWLKFQRDGKRRYISLDTSDPVEAITRGSGLRTHQFPDQKTPFLRSVDVYLAEKNRLNLYSRATARVHGAVLREFGERVEGRSLEAVPQKLAHDHYKALQARVSETTAQIHIRALRAFFNAQKKICRINPFAELELGKIDQPARVVFCTKAQRNELIKAEKDDDLQFIFLAGFDAGLRKNEIIEARVFFFDMNGHATHLQNTATLRLKDNEARTIPMTKRFRRFLGRYLKGKKPNDFALKPDVEHGKGTYRYDFHRPFNDFLDAVDENGDSLGRRTMTFNGQRITAHVMRHTFASLLVQAGVSVYKVARWLGDGVAVVEDHYGHLAPKDSDIEKAQ
ncbi:MAG: site-specific integrase [Verrucomicrobiota bacterium]|nr:site-specific integrase [Verrucomicrobiota bacterium]